MTLMRNEFIRKSIHLSSIWMPAAIYFLPQIQTIALFAFLTAAALVVEYIRRKTPQINAFFKDILRSHEQGEASYKYAGATWMLMGVLFSSLFPDFIAVTAICVLIISDTFASLIGMRFGRTRMFGKSLEGSGAFFVSGLAVIIALGHVFAISHYFLLAAPALAVTTLGELVSTRLKLDDNLFIPALMCGSMLGLAALI